MRLAAGQPRRPRFSTETRSRRPAARGRSGVPPAPPPPARVTAVSLSFQPQSLLEKSPLRPFPATCLIGFCSSAAPEPAQVCLSRGEAALLLSGLKLQQRLISAMEAADACSPGGFPKASLSPPPPLPLGPQQLKNRSRGIQTEERAGRNPYFTLEGHEFLILGGSVHYFRVPRASWRDRLLKLRACGFNTVTTYVPWNLHEPQRGTFDFSGNLDLEAFILLAEEVGLWVILRPGPYICSEMDLGGLPSWLLQDPTSQLRTTNRSFVNAVNKYFDHLIPRVAPLQYRRGGPIIAVQVENEYGSFYKDKAYMPYLLQALLQRGIGGLLLTADSTEEVTRGHTKGVFLWFRVWAGTGQSQASPGLGVVWQQEAVLSGARPPEPAGTPAASPRALRVPLGSRWRGDVTQQWRTEPKGPGLLATINMKGFKVDSFKHLYKLQSHKPIVIMEFWVGWFDTWGNDHKVMGVNEVEKSVSEFIRFGISFNVYMFHGGTNFGFMNGATSFEKHRDYDAVLTEAGDYTTKYFALRNLFESILGTQLPFCWGAAPPREVVGGGRRGKGSPWAET
ncbi:hypothetical protein Celaphus_00009445 [Cervus elaphus hippelaphus]|uniref:Glycoside hydrolase 35 catalytic domain-containing protein n=1 Tax=Cervus elaphus hippelaphus TaxID=46360 RepID=A0A212DHR6_CEREH|nr:hypothetical protein Celaphus_00009445 [Cervus elaphus hippelaphus]